MCEFNRDDVIAMARHFVENWQRWEDSDYSHYYGLCCRFCDAPAIGHSPAEQFDHELDCPVLIAKGVLTGEEDENNC